VLEASVSAGGRITGEAEVLIADVPRRTVTTPARALGDTPPLLLAAAALLLAARPALRRRDPAEGDPEESVNHGQ
jgi:apolipoprotein N-acyltransferase